MEVTEKPKSSFQVISDLLMMEVTEKPQSITHLAIETDTQLTHHIVAMKKVAE